MAGMATQRPQAALDSLQALLTHLHMCLALRHVLDIKSARVRRSCHLHLQLLVGLQTPRYLRSVSRRASESEGTQAMEVTLACLMAGRNACSLPRSSGGLTGPMRGFCLGSPIASRTSTDRSAQEKRWQGNLSLRHRARRPRPARTAGPDSLKVCASVCPWGTSNEEHRAPARAAAPVPVTAGTSSRSLFEGVSLPMAAKCPSTDAVAQAGRPPDMAVQGTARTSCWRQDGVRGRWAPGAMDHLQSSHRPSVYAEQGLSCPSQRCSRVTSRPAGPASSCLVGGPCA